MSVQSIFGETSAEQRLKLKWETLGNPIATSVQIALDSEFTKETRTFVLDKSVKSCALDVGFGKWFYRIGAWIGTDKDGIIEWSGIYGPVDIKSNKSYIPLKPFPTFLTNIKPALNSIVFHTGLYEPYYMIIHSTENHTFQSSGMKSYYKHDWGNGTIHFSNLDPQLTYSFQLQMFATNKSEIPSGNTIQLLTDMYIVKNKKAGMPVKATSNSEQAIYAADKAILNDAIGRQKQNFFSYSQYLQFKAAKARTSAQQ